MQNENSSRGIRTRMFVSLLALVLVLGCAIGGTIAWLTAKTDPVTNTFTVGKVDIKLEETTGDTYKIIPGHDIAKDPKVTVKAGSEKCWLFVKVEANDAMKKAFNNGAKWVIADGWLSLNVHIDNNTVVYYRQVNASEVDQEFDVLKDNLITVSEDWDGADSAEVNGAAVAPTLTFTAYAIQYEGFAAPEDTTGWTPTNAWTTVYSAYAPASTATPAPTTDPSDAPPQYDD